MTELICTDWCSHLCKNLKGNFRVIPITTNKDNSRYFPDGEIYTRLNDITPKERTVILHSGSPEPNEGLTQLEMILAILKRANIGSEIFFTYFPYAMQDKVFQKGETAFAFDLIDKFLKYYQAKRIFILDPHFEIANRKVIKISALDLLVEKIKANFKDVIFIAPDEGGGKRTGFPYLKKKRIDSFHVEYQIDRNLLAKIKSRNVAIIDDILETGGTLLKIHEFVKRFGAKEIIAGVTHAVLPEGIKKVFQKYDKLYFTNSINKKNGIDIKDLITKSILENYS